MKQEMLDNYQWVRCRNCGHKLFKISKNADIVYFRSLSEHDDLRSEINDKPKIEIKCHSCKNINIIAHTP